MTSVNALIRSRYFAASSNSGIMVYLRGGVYELGKTFQLTAQDSGSEKVPVVYRAYVDKRDPDNPKTEKVHIIGGREVKNFGPIKDAEILSRIDKKYHGKILQANLKGQEIVDYGKLTPRGMGRKIQPAGLELFFNNKPMQLARWPNKGWEKVVRVPRSKDGSKFTYKGDRPKRWEKADDIWLHGYWKWDWADSYVKVKSINLLKREITTQAPHGVYGYTPGKRFYVLNLLEELDSPGEWYLDRKSGVLYFWPPAPLKKEKVFVSIIPTIVRMQNTSHVTIRDFTFEYCRGTAVTIKGGTRNLVAGCTIRNTGNRAATVVGGTQNGVRSCDIYETGDGGIMIAGGSRKTLTKAHNFADNNHIYRYSRWCRTYRLGRG